MAELVDAEESESSIFDVQVQVLSAAPYNNNRFDIVLQMQRKIRQRAWEMLDSSAKRGWDQREVH